MQKHAPVDNSNASMIRTADNSIAKESRETSLSTSNLSSKQKLITLLLDRSRMSPTHEEDSLIKALAGEEVEDMSRRSNERSSRRTLSKKSPQKDDSASKNQFDKKTTSSQQNFTKQVGVNTKSSAQSSSAREGLSGRDGKAGAVKQGSVQKFAPDNKQYQPLITPVKQEPQSDRSDPSKLESETKMVQSPQESEISVQKIENVEAIQSEMTIETFKDPQDEPKALQQENEKINEQMDVSFSAHKDQVGESSEKSERNIQGDDRRSSNGSNNVQISKAEEGSNDTSVLPDSELELQTAIKGLNIKIFLVIYNPIFFCQ